MRRSFLALAFVLATSGVAGCKSEIEFVRKDKKDDGKPQGADDAVPGDKTQPPGPGSGSSPTVGDDSFRAGTEAPDAEVVDEPQPGPGPSPSSSGDDDDDAGGTTASGPGPGPGPSPTTAGEPPTGPGSGPGPGPSPTTDGGTTASPGPGPSPTTDGGTTAGPGPGPNPTTDGGTTAGPGPGPNPTTDGGTTAGPGPGPSPTTTDGGTTAGPGPGPVPNPTTGIGGTTGGGTTGGGSGGPKEYPTHILVVDWGALVTFYWKIPGADSADIAMISEFSKYKKDYPVPARDLPAGAWPLDTHLLDPGTYLVTLVAKYPNFEERHRVRLRVRPLLQLQVANPNIKPKKNVPFPIWVKVPAGATRVRLYLDGAKQPFLVMRDLSRGRHPATVTPEHDLDNLTLGTIVKHGVRGRDARLVVKVVDDPGQTPTDPNPPSPYPPGQNPPSPYPPGQNPPSPYPPGQNPPLPYPPGQNPPSPYPPGQNPPSPYPPGQNPPSPYPPGQNPPNNPYPPTPPPPLPECPAHDPSSDGAVSIPLHLVDTFPGNCQRLAWRGDIGSIEHAEGENCKSADHLTARHDWYAAKQFRLPADVVQGSLRKTHSGKPLPKDTTNDGFPDFPLVDYEALKSKVSGTLTSYGVPASSWHDAIIPAEMVTPKAQRNVVIVGNVAHPFQIDGEVLILGDLVIKGRYVGTGTIYVSGNVYIPHDLIATDTAFPFSEVKATAIQQGKDRVCGKDGLAIVAGGRVFAGDNYPQYANPVTNANVQAMYTWYPGGKSSYKRLYEPVWNCQTNAVPSYTKKDYEHCDCNVHGGFNVIEASLYALKGVYGSSGAWLDAKTYIPNSYAIDGAVLTTSFDIVSTPDLCATPNAAHPMHGYPQGKSYVNFDFRLLHGLNAFSQLKPAFKGN